MTGADDLPSRHDTLVLVPGLVCDADLFAEQSAALRAGGLRVVVPDVSGGASMGEMADAVLAAAPERFALAGLSMGGYVAQQVVRQAPDRVTALALLDTSARPESAAQTERRRGLERLGRERGYGAVLDALWPAEVAPSRHGDTALRARFDRMCGGFGLEVFVRQQQAITARLDSRPLLAGLGVPVLVLCGRDDAITPLDHHDEMARLAPTAALVVLDDCGHLSTWERPDEVTAALRSWLAR